VLTPETVILALKLAVGAVTVLLLASLAALAAGRQRLHGRLNVVFFALTVAALVGFEAVIRLIDPALFDALKADPELYRNLNVHLCFAVPSAVLMPVMLFSGLKHRRGLHVGLALLFGALWAGTFVTGVFFL
jgi:hypothetical protein